MITTDRWNQVWREGLSFDAYIKAWPEHTLATQDTPMGVYVALNEKRVQRWLKTQPWKSALPNDLHLNEKWIVITEYWCGDAAHCIPPLQDIAKAAGVEVRYIFRDENLDIMDAYLTNGGRSIPKLIRLTGDFNEVVGTWGPRPQEAQSLYDELRRQHDDYKQILEPMQKWYNANKGALVVSELLDELTIEKE
jgi:hypothetical protein